MMRRISMMMMRRDGGKVGKWRGRGRKEGGIEMVRGEVLKKLQ